MDSVEYSSLIQYLESQFLWHSYSFTWYNQPTDMYPYSQRFPHRDQYRIKPIKPRWHLIYGLIIGFRDTERIID